MKSNDQAYGQPQPVSPPEDDAAREEHQVQYEQETGAVYAEPAAYDDQPAQEAYDAGAYEQEAAYDAAAYEETTQAPDQPAETEPPAPAPAQPAMSDSDLFLAAMSGDMPVTDEEGFGLKAPQRGDFVTGVIARKSENEIMVDIGAKSEGTISGQELTALDPETVANLNIGDEIKVYIYAVDERDGHARLSLRRALEEQDWESAQEYIKSGKAYQTKIVGHNKGGLLAQFGKLRGFIPASQISLERRRAGEDAGSPEESWRRMHGDPVTVKVIEMDRSRNRLILSERAANKETRSQRRSELLGNLQVGEVRTGRVTSMTDFGAFVDLGGIDGLVHLSEMAWEHVTHPDQVFKVGDKVEVEVIEIDRDRQRIGLSRKRRLQDPWTRIDEIYRVGQLVRGTITKMTKFGAFARMADQPAIEGLIHISELSDRRIKHPREAVEEGQELTLRVVRIEADKRRVGLSLRQVDSEAYADEDWFAFLDSDPNEEK